MSKNLVWRVSTQKNAGLLDPVLFSTHNIKNRERRFLCLHV